MSIAACKHCGVDIVFFWDQLHDRWRPGDIESLTGNEEIYKGGCIYESYHRLHRCPSKLKRRVVVPSDPYTILHLLPSAPPEVVRAAWLALSRLHHPDSGGTHEKMIEINSAYETLRVR